MSESVQPHRRQPTRLFPPWDSSGKNTGVRCHFLLQCMKVESESEVTQSCLTLSDPMDCSLPGSSIHGIFQARVLEWGAIAFSWLLVISYSLVPLDSMMVSMLLIVAPGYCTLSYGSPICYWKWKLLSCVWLFTTPWTWNSPARILE